MLPTHRSCPSEGATDLDRVRARELRDRFTVRGAETVARLRQTLHDGNVLRIWIKDEDGRTLIEIPTMLGVRGGLRMAPVWAAVGALASVSGKLTVEVKREPAWPLDGPRNGPEATGGRARLPRQDDHGQVEPSGRVAL